MKIEGKWKFEYGRQQIWELEKGRHLSLTNGAETSREKNIVHTKLDMFHSTDAFVNQ